MLTTVFKVIILVCVSVAANAATVYVSQSGGTFSGGSACNGQTAESVATLNAASQSPGDIIYLCGALTSPPQATSSGSSGNVITYRWDTGARVSLTHGQMIGFSLGTNAYLLFDGLIPCGPNTACDAVEAANLTGYATGQAGIIEATANGGALANQDISTQAFYGCNGCHDIEIRNMIIRNLYVHSGLSDAVANSDTATFSFQCAEGNSGCAAGVISIHDSTIHDCGNGVSIQRMNSATANIYNIDFYHNNWSMEDSGDGARTVSFHDNHIHDTTNWDTTGDFFHHNGVHMYMAAGATDSTLTSMYNNMSDGNWGSCCTTTTMLYTEITNPANFNVFNNVCLQHSGDVAPCIQYGATTGVFANNTALGVTTSGNVEAYEVYGSGITFENNAASGYGQFVVAQAGTTFSALDYNQWGTTEGSGNPAWVWNGSGGQSTFAAWQSACSCDSHGGNPASIGVNSTGIPQSGSALIGAGLNLTSLSITALNSTSSGGNTMATVARGSSGSWTVGAYNLATSITSNGYLQGATLSGSGSVGR